MIVKVVGAVLIEDNKILIAQRPLNKSMGGYWEFPGGKIESGESPQEALVREIREELNCSIVVKELITTSTFKTSESIIKLTTYYCSMVRGELTVNEHIQIAWIPPEDLDKFNWAPADIDTVNILKKELLG